MTSEQNIIDIALHKKEMLTIHEFIKETKYPMNNLFRNKFWQSVINDDNYEWIFLRNDIINNIFTEDSKDKVNQCYEILTNKGDFNINSKWKFETDRDYKEVDKDHPLVKPHLKEEDIRDGDKFYIINPTSVKRLILKSRTPLAENVYDYYINLEQISKIYSEYQDQYKQQNQNKTDPKLRPNANKRKKSPKSVQANKPKKSPKKSKSDAPSMKNIVSKMKDIDLNDNADDNDSNSKLNDQMDKLKEKMESEDNITCARLKQICANLKIDYNDAKKCTKRINRDKKYIYVFKISTA